MLSHLQNMAGGLYSGLFLPVGNMSLTASAVIGAVLLARLALRRAPKIFSYALWAVVLFRLLCPVSIPLPFSLLGALDTPARTAAGGMGSAVSYVLRYDDGSYDVLREHSSLEGWGIWYENEGQALHDWYVDEQGLDQPRYVEDWINRLPVLAEAGYDSYPARRFEGEGWSLLVPCGDPFWRELQGDGSQGY